MKVSPNQLRRIGRHAVKKLTDNLVSCSEPTKKLAVEWSAEEFSSIYIQHKPAIYHLSLRYLGNLQMAEDATQEVFLKALRKWKQFRGESSFRTWLHQIAIHHCLNLNSTWQERHVCFNTDNSVLERAATEIASPINALEAKELGRQIQQTLRRLSQEYQLLLWLVAETELSYSEIAAIVGQSPSAVRGKMHRARKRFALLFNEIGCERGGKPG
jgi:RNA polymerase sigma-70 factor (ECF subfamily)